MKTDIDRPSMQDPRSPHARSSVVCILLLIFLCYQCDGRRLMTTTEPDGAPAPANSPTFLFPPFPMPENLTTSSTKPPYCIWPPILSLPPPSIQTPPPPPFYFTPIIPVNPPPMSVPSPPDAMLNPPPPPQTISNPPPTIYVPNPPETVPSPPSGSTPNPPVTNPSPPSSNYPPVFQPPVVYPPPSVPSLPPPGGQQGLWCVAKPAVPDPIIQEAMDYACGSGADCTSILDAGPCSSPNTLLNHASFAFNSYWQRTKVTGGTCDFGGIATLITVDPSYDGCRFVYN